MIKKNKHSKKNEKKIDVFVPNDWTTSYRCKCRLFHSAKKMYTADHGHGRMQFAVPIKRSCAKIEIKKGTLDFTEMLKRWWYIEDFHQISKHFASCRYSMFRKLHARRVRNFALSHETVLHALQDCSSDYKL